VHPQEVNDISRRDSVTGLNWRANCSETCQIRLAEQQNVAYNSPRLAVLRARSLGPRSHGFVECFGKTIGLTEIAKEKYTTLRRTPVSSVRSLI
jgi:hypothetical protein